MALSNVHLIPAHTPNRPNNHSGRQTACDMYDTAILTSQTAPRRARAAALILVQAKNPSITLTL